MATFWTTCLEQADAQSKAMLEYFQALGNPQQFQRQWLQMLSQSLDNFMRSPAFLEAMQRNFKAMTDLKALQDQMIEDAARQIGAPLASDIYGLFERLHSVEQTILSRLKAIEGRLAAIESRLDIDRNSHH
jgi:hypothetical protein